MKHSIGGDWLKDCKSPEEAKQRTDLILGSEGILKILRLILVGRKAGLRIFKESDYENGSWSHLQAHRNGRQEEIDYVLNLLTIRERPTNDDRNQTQRPTPLFATDRSAGRLGGTG